MNHTNDLQKKIQKETKFNHDSQNHNNDIILFQDLSCICAEILSISEFQCSIKKVVQMVSNDADNITLLLGSRLLGSDGVLQLGSLNPLFACLTSNLSILTEGILKAEIEHTIIKHSASTLVVLRFPQSDNPALFDAVILFTCDEKIAESCQHLYLFLERQLQIVVRRIIDLKRRHESQLEKSETDHALIELCDSLVGDDSPNLQRKVLSYLMDQTSATTACMLMLVSGSSLLACNVIGSSILEDTIYINFETGLFRDVVKYGNTLIMSTLSETDSQSLQPLISMGFTPSLPFICVPLTCKSTGKRVAVCCLAGKRDAQSFTDSDHWLITQCLRYTGPILTYSCTFQSEIYLKQQTERMLHVVRNIFSHMDDLESLLKEIMTEARRLTNAERCSVFLVDRQSMELVAKVFDGLDETRKGEIRVPLTTGICGKVASTGELMNVTNAYKHPLFFPGVDQVTGFKTKTLLSFPIQDQDGVVVGVAQLCNKISGKCFTKLDEEVAKAFSVYCCISIVHTLMFKQAKDSQNRSQLANELMVHHMLQHGEDDIETLVQSELVSCSQFFPGFDQFSAIPRAIQDKDTVMGSMSMFHDLNLFSRWRMSRHTVARFLSLVRRGYRPLPYHNWYHGFSVGHFVYLCITHLKLNSSAENTILKDIEVVGLFVAALCHDLDHRGTTNSFQERSHSILAALYSSEGSVLEHHHFSQTLSLLNSQGCNIFENLSGEEYTEVLDIMRDVILATDLAAHLRLMPELARLATPPSTQDFPIPRGIDSSQPRERRLLCRLLITSADLNDQTKSWHHTRSTAELVCKEFFAQGDLERAMGVTPMPQMDRERVKIPEMQIGFLDHIVIPLYKILVTIFPSASELLVNIKRHRGNWEAIGRLVDEGTITQDLEDIFRRPVIPADFET